MKHIHTFESFLNEAASFKSESDAYKEAVDILKSLHSYSNKIKFRVDNVNGTDNIVYDDEKMVTAGILDRLKDRRFWNTGFDATTGKFSGNRININFDKSVQDTLNIKDFDKKNWSPKGF
jgi:hypothetical protein